jgi:hypothetical protein
VFALFCKRFAGAALLIAISYSLAAAADPPAVVILDGAGMSWREARQIIEQYGGRVDLVAVPSVLVGYIPEGAAAALAQAPRAAPGLAIASAPSGIRIVRTRVAAEALLGVVPGAAILAAQAPAAGVISAEAQAALRLLAPQNPSITQSSDFRVLAGGMVEERPITELESRPLLPPAPSDPRIANAIGTTFDNTSGFLAGDVAVGIIRPESTGAGGGDGLNTEDWTANEVTNSLAQVMAALDKLTGNSPRGKLTFILRTESFGPGVAGTVSSDYEAIEYANWTSSVVLNFLGKLGYTQTGFYNRLREWDNDLRSDLGTDWAYGFIIVDNSSNTAQGRASAYLNGPGAWLFQSNSARVYHHESGHVWGAQDEYHPDAAEPPISRWGYTQEPNANSQFRARHLDERL